MAIAPLLRMCLLFFLVSSFLQFTHPTDPNNEVKFNFFPFFIVYKSGRVQRILPAASFIPASIDPTSGVTSKDVIIDPKTNISARLYLPKFTNTKKNKKKLPVLVFYHGGWFCFGSAFAPDYHRLINSIVSQANMVAVSVNYRLAPEHLLPAAYDDSWAALKWAVVSIADSWLGEHGDFNHVFIAGDSAGGNIVHNLAMRAGREEDEGVKIEGMVLLNPYFWGSKPIGSEPTNPRERGIFDNMWGIINKDGVGVDDPTSNPMAEGAPSLAKLGCRKVLVCIAEKDILKDRGRAYYKALKESEWRGKVKLVMSKGGGHVFILTEPKGPRALQLMRWFIAFFKL